MTTDERRFRLLYEANLEPILRYALRRVASPEDAADVVAETFLTAWRRLDDVPRGADARLWLFGVARRVLANHARGEVRRHRLGERLRRELATHAPGRTDAARDDVREVRSALGRLGDTDREILTLHAWEGLAPRQIATVLGLPAGTVRTRLSRARSRLQAELAGDAPPGSGHVESVRPRPAPEEAR